MPFTSLIATLAIAASCVSAQQITITALATDAAKVYASKHRPTHHSRTSSLAPAGF